MAKRKKVAIPKPELNITAMMDLVLNLITFFALVANFSSQSLPALSPPKPDKSVVSKNEAKNQLTVNVLPGPIKGEAGEVLLGAHRLKFGDSDTLRSLLEKEKSISTDVEINLRADKSLRYDQVQPVMLAIVNAGISKIHLVAQSTE